MENSPSPLETLRQLKEMLDAGALTPTEFEALKQRLVFTPGTTSPATAEPPAATASPSTPPAPPTGSQPEQLAAPLSSPDVNHSVPPTPEVAKVDALVFEPVAEPLFMSEAAAGFPVAVGGPGYVRTEALPDDQEADLTAAPAAQNSSLGLVLAIAGVLVFLAVVAYLGFTRPATDEHISSISQTAADSVGTAIETGPQAAPLPATAAVPETVRVAPTNPAPVIQPRPAAPVADSAAPPATNSPAADSTGKQ